MKDFSINLPSWAIREGYSLEGGQGTYDDLFLSKDGSTVKTWWCSNKSPNIFEMEEIIHELESEEAISRCQVTY